ncbi:MAG: VWA-like domain-containing protein [Bacilli bacterium]
MNVESIKRRLLVKYPFFGSVVANCNFIAEPAVGTAGTDGKNIYYNPNFIESITDDQQTFIFAHEICHIAFDHIFRSESKDKDLWNIATDSVVNAFLKQDGLPIVEDGVDIPEAINYDAEEMYKKLLEKKKQQQQNGQGNGQNQQGSQQQSSSSGENSQEKDKQSQEQSGNGSSKDSQEEEKQQDVGHDTHSMWDKAIEKRHQEEQQQPDEKQNKEQEKKKNEEIKKLTELGEKEAFKQNKIERNKQLEELRKALASQSHGHGNTTNSERRNITDIGTSEPLIDWRRLLKEAVKYDIDWSYQNAGIEDGVVTAYLEEMPRPETEIVLDTSGSIDETLLRNFLRECKNILKTSKVKVGCFDTQFYGFTEIKDVSDIDNLPFYGGGGTNFEVAVNAFTRRVENKIIFTDGDANMPNKPIDAIWIVFGGIKINPAGGKVIHIDDEQLERLCNYQMKDEPKVRTR